MNRDTWSRATSAAPDSHLPPPNKLRAAVSGDTVRLDWDVEAPASGWLVEAGSAPGQSNLAVISTSSRSLTATNVPPGTYYVRVRSALANFSQLSAPSNEIVVTVGGGCVGPPGAPTSLVVQMVSGSNVTLGWAAPPGPSPSSYVLDVGSASGLSNLLVFDTGNAATTLQAVAAPGVYFVRARARSACGLSPPSNEIVVNVGTTAPQNAVFVNSTRGNDGNPGSPTAPVATIQRGIDLASSRGGGSVRIAAGNYSERLRLRSSVSLEGGFDPDTWIRSALLVTRVLGGVVPFGPAETIIGERVTNVSIKYLTVTAPSRSGNGVSAIAIRLSDSQAIEIHDNQIIAGNGSNGLPGAGGRNGTAGDPGGNGGAAGIGGGGAGSPAGAASGAPRFGGRGAAGRTGVAAAGLRGQNGTTVAPYPAAAGGDGGTAGSRNGRSGQPGITPVNGGRHGRPAPVLGFGFITYEPADGEPGGKGPDGHGGGGGGSGFVDFSAFPSGGGGGGGQGGEGGDGGGGGDSGGSSIGILLLRSTSVDIQRNIITTGNGGAGGAGGRRGLGGQGGAGGGGGAGGISHGAGGSGGPGGDGREGGHGGSGSGGSSIGIMSGGSSYTGVNSFALGVAGLGGCDSIAPFLCGPGGLSQATVQLPATPLDPQ